MAHSGSWPKTNPAERGLGHAHRQERERLLPLAYGKTCPYFGVDPRCPGPMLKGQALDLDHGRARALGGRTGDGTGRIAHTSCNRRAGARLGVRLRRGKSAKIPKTRATVPVSRYSRRW